MVRAKFRLSDLNKDLEKLLVEKQDVPEPILLLNFRNIWNWLAPLQIPQRFQATIVGRRAILKWIEQTLKKLKILKSYEESENFFDISQISETIIQESLQYVRVEIDDNENDSTIPDIHKRLQVYDPNMRDWYPASIVAINENQTICKLHYDGWPNEWDEYIPINSERLRIGLSKPSNKRKLKSSSKSSKNRSRSVSRHSTENSGKRTKYSTRKNVEIAEQDENVNDISSELPSNLSSIDLSNKTKILSPPILPRIEEKTKKNEGQTNIINDVTHQTMDDKKIKTDMEKDQIEIKEEKEEENEMESDNILLQYCETEEEKKNFLETQHLLEKYEMRDEIVNDWVVEPIPERIVCVKCGSSNSLVEAFGKELKNKTSGFGKDIQKKINNVQLLWQRKFIKNFKCINCRRIEQFGETDIMAEKALRKRHAMFSTQLQLRELEMYLYKFPTIDEKEHERLTRKMTELKQQLNVLKDEEVHFNENDQVTEEKKIDEFKSELTEEFHDAIDITTYLSDILLSLSYNSTDKLENFPIS
ncbi:hypothetical protein SNEBB_010207 [Seison nebaliae]|nr:hypothetical protein SNEBB_010207 [Seison nebaliae]